MPYVSIEETVWVDLDDFDTEDLVEEVNRRDGAIKSKLLNGGNAKELVDEIYMAKHVRNQPYDHLVDQLISVVLGRVL